MRDLCEHLRPLAFLMVLGIREVPYVLRQGLNLIRSWAKGGCSTLPHSGPHHHPASSSSMFPRQQVSHFWIPRSVLAFKLRCWSWSYLPGDPAAGYGFAFTTKEKGLISSISSNQTGWPERKLALVLSQPWMEISLSYGALNHKLLSSLFSLRLAGGTDNEFVLFLSLLLCTAPLRWCQPLIPFFRDKKI